MDRLIISIGRQFGSGGRAVGRLLAEKFGITYYDKEIISRASKESGISDEFFKQADEKGTYSVTGSYNLEYPVGSIFLPMLCGQNSLSGNSLFKMQSDTIRNIARESCVIIGRCANYVLREDKALFSVFISADLEWRIKRVGEAKEYGTDLENVKTAILKADKMRSSYYNFYTNNTWGEAETYDLCIKSSSFGVEKTADLIYDAIKAGTAKN